MLAYSGHPRQQMLVVDRTMVPTLTRPSQTVPLEPNDVQRYENIALVDLRFGRSWTAGRVRFQPFLDIYNLTNANTVLADVTTFGSELRARLRDDQSAHPEVWGQSRVLIAT